MAQQIGLITGSFSQIGLIELGFQSIMGRSQNRGRETTTKRVSNHVFALVVFQNVDPSLNDEFDIGRFSGPGVMEDLTDRRGSDCPSLLPSVRGLVLVVLFKGDGPSRSLSDRAVVQF
ncbi:hypothetical protein HAX54_034985 [Datura stramonium]|uniref:Uncharacterized protein n=1 Tax=Datura stramonium TaxID=4076 RepID=A0ABS8VGF1_DATST|nr:hypothetical protein [Datura stramonium]